MRRTASEVIRELQQRVARLEMNTRKKRASRTGAGDIPRYVLQDAIQELTDDYADEYADDYAEDIELDARKFTLEEKATSRSSESIKYYLLTIHEENSGHEFAVIISCEYGDYQVESTYGSHGQAMRSWEKWTR